MAVRARWVVGGLLAAVALAWAWWEFGRDRAPAEVADRPAAVTAATCETDAACVGRQHVAAAAAACRAGIEDLAGFGVRWSDAAGGPRFTRFAWRDRAGGAIVFVGDAAQFRSAGGDFSPVTYECDFDPAAGRALDARVRAGRMP